MRLKGKIALVTGAARGIGREIAVIFAREGASLGIIDIDQEKLDRVSDEIDKIGVCVHSAQGDISNKEDLVKIVNQILEAFGRIDILVNNAVYAKYGKFIDYEENEWKKVMDVGLKGYFLSSQLVAKEMIKKRKGKIISIASVAGQLGFQRTCAYGSAKGGVIALTKIMAVELASYGINVNAIAPGPIDTDLFRSLNSGQDIEDRIKRIPLGRLGTPEDIGKAAIFLASADSDYITGHILQVDGGFSAAGILARD